MVVILWKVVRYREFRIVLGKIRRISEEPEWIAAPR